MRMGGNLAGAMVMGSWDSGKRTTGENQVAENHSNQASEDSETGAKLLGFKSQCLSLTPSQFTSYMTLGRLLNLFVSPFSYL